MRFILPLLLVFSGAAFAAGPASNDQTLGDRHAIQDAHLLQKFSRQDLVLSRRQLTPATTDALQKMFSGNESGMRTFSHSNNCDPDNGAGSAACWRACENEGYSSSTCAPRCGVSTDGGSEECWKACSNEGYSSSTCGPRCGNSTDAGSAACWRACENEGYSSSTCAPRCGVNTNGGSAECWKACTNEGYSSSTCAPRCGVN